MIKYPKLLNAKVNGNLSIILHYENNENRELNLEKYMISEYFKELEDIDYLSNFKIQDNTLSWENEQDIAPETIYKDSILILN